MPEAGASAVTSPNGEGAAAVGWRFPRGRVRKGVRFSPPRWVELSPELEWLLGRAFGPPDRCAEGERQLDVEKVRDLSRRLDLQPRVAARTPFPQLVVALGESAAGEFQESFHGVAVQTASLRRVCRDLAKVGQALATPIIVLKGMALDLCGTVKLGSRPILDLDILVPVGRAGVFYEHLLAQGYRQAAPEGNVQHLPVLASPVGLQVDVHTSLHMTRGPGGHPLSADDLLGGGLCEAMNGLPAGTFVPVADIRVAHLLVHGLAQHGMQAGKYPFGRTVADVADIGWSDERWEGFLEGPFRFVAREVSADEARALARLASALRSGEPVKRLVEAPGVGVVLRHWLAANLDEDYRRALILRPGQGEWIVPLLRRELASLARVCAGGLPNQGLARKTEPSTGLPGYVISVGRRVGRLSSRMLGFCLASFRVRFPRKSRVRKRA